jgi:hypothetical protein
MKCPVCHLENPPSAEQCDCGHAFMANVLRSVDALKIPAMARWQNQSSEFDSTPVASSASSLVSWGRVSVILGIIAMIIGIPVWIASTSSVFVAGLTLLAQGSLLLAGGRMISCLVAIEKNTRRLNG